MWGEQMNFEKFIRRDLRSPPTATTAPVKNHLILRRIKTTAMYYRIPLRSYLLPSRMAGAAAQKGPNHFRALSVANMRADPTRPTTDQGESSRSKIMGLDRDKVYIGGGLVAIGAIWYYYAMVEHARIDGRREGSAAGNAEGGRTQAVEGTSRSVKDRTKESLKSAQ